MGIREIRERARENAQFQSRLGTFFIQDGALQWLPEGTFKTQRRPIGGATATFESGAVSDRSTVTRVAAGALIAGPVGAIVGGMLKKQTGRVYVTVTFADGSVAIADAPAGDEAKAREFAAKVNTAGAHYPVADGS